MEAELKTKGSTFTVFYLITLGLFDANCACLMDALLNSGIFFQLSSND